MGTARPTIRDPFEGRLDEVALYDWALDAHEIVAHRRAASG
jgi:hypothetical protein